MYGRGVASIAEQIGKTPEEAQEILDKFYQEFPAVKKWMDETQEGARKNGYVEDLWGRRRQLPDIQLPPYEIRLKGNNSNLSNFNPLIGSKGLINKEISPLILKYQKLLKNVKFRRDVENIKKDALRENVEILNNQGFIAEAERQSINARIQGGAASMSKKAIVSIYKDAEMNRLGFRLLIMVHDELIGECPIENKEAVIERLSYLMSQSGKPEVDLPMKCDALAFSHWYEDEYTDMVCNEFDKLSKKESLTKDDIFKSLLETHSELLPEELSKMLQSRLQTVA